MVHELLQILTVTIAVGSLYALVALGYTLVYGVLKFINFAHSDVFVLGAWTSFTTAVFLIATSGLDSANPPWWLGVLVFVSALVVCGGVGYCIERFAYRPLRKAPRLNVLITAIGVSLLLQNVGQITGGTVARSEQGAPLATVPFGATPKRMPTLLPEVVLNERVLASGRAQGGAARGVVVLDRTITLEEGRQYRLAITREQAIEGPAGTGQGGTGQAGTGQAGTDQPGTNQAKRTIEESLGIAMDAGTYEAGQELRTTPRRTPQELAGARYELRRSPRVPINLIDVIIVVVSLSLMVGLQLLIYRTKMGSAMRALSHNVETASLMGINTNRVISFTFVLGSVLAASAAFLYPMKYPGLNQTAHGIWVLLGLKAFVAAVVGGIGNVRGAVLGGFLIAAIEFFGAWAYAPLRDVYVFAVLILVLLYKPNGLLGKAVTEKV